MSEKKTDRRTLKTRKAICDAFAELLYEKELHTNGNTVRNDSNPNTGAVFPTAAVIVLSFAGLTAIK